MNGKAANQIQKEKLSRPTSFAVYIHIPFCEKKCDYCDFVSFYGDGKKIDKYVNVLCREIDYLNLADTVFIGGGTPSLLTNKQISQIFTKLKMKPDAEVTIEANPNSITEDKLKHWLSLGINRISIGVQSFDDDVLKILNRIHNSNQAVNAVKMAYDAGFSNISIDLIHSVPSAPLKGNILKENLKQIIPFITHISAYALIIEPGTLFAEKFMPVSDRQSLAEQKMIESVIKEFGLKKYEVSSFSKPGFECRHNQAYWLPQVCEYQGFGLGAHSLVDNKRFSNTKNLDEYIDKNKAGKQNIEERSEKEIITEIIMLGLRTIKGISLDYLTDKNNEIKILKELKLVKISGNKISATEKGFRVLNKVIEMLTP